MCTNHTVMTYRIPEPFERALKSVREAVTRRGLSVPFELDISRRINRELGIALAPCRVLYVDHPLLLVQAMALDGSAAGWLPQQVVVSGRGPQTLVQVVQPAGSRSNGSEQESPVEKVRSRLSRALQAVAMRESDYQTA